MSASSTFPAARFEISAGERDGLPAVGILNVALAEYSDCQQYPWLVEIEILAKELAERGMPTMEEVDQLNAVEERLQEHLAERKAHFIARQTWNGRRMLDFYVADGPTVQRHFDQLIRQNDFSRTFSVRISQDADWDVWMPTLMRMNQPAQDCGVQYNQSLLVPIPLGGGEFGSDEEQEAVLELADTLSDVIAESGVGEFDGYEFGNFEALLFAYGNDADALLATMEPTLKNSPVAKQASITKQYGMTDEESTREETVEL
jgi:hypothetical protein